MAQMLTALAVLPEDLGLHLSKHLHGGSQPSITLVPRSLVFIYVIYRCCMHVMHMHTYRQTNTESLF